MGAPTPAIFPEIYLQYIEHIAIIDILTQHNVQAYFRYVDDILLTYNIDNMNIHHVLEKFNVISPKLTFTLEEQHGKQLNYMDITITRNEKQFTFHIYRKPTTTDHIIPKDSCHPQEHKTSVIRYLVNRMETYPIDQKTKYKKAKPSNTYYKQTNTIPTYL
jgi:hypothetical protein